MKKILAILFTMILFISCDVKMAENAFNSGDYVTAVGISMNYINSKGLNNIKESDRQILLDKLSQVVDIYENKLKDNYDRSYVDNYEYFSILYLISTNREVLNILPASIKNNDAKYYFEKANQQFRNKYEEQLRYNEKTTLYELPKSISKVYSFIESKNLSNSSYSKQVQDLKRTLADIYNEIGRLEENFKNLKEARNAYNNSYNVYKSYSANYNGNYSNYVRLNRQIAYEEYVEYTRKADNNMIAREYVEAVKNYNSAIQALKDYRNDYRSEISDLEYKIKKAEEGAKYQLAETYYNQAADIVLRARTKDDYKKAADLFKKASSYIYNYRDSEKLAEKYYNMYKEYNGNSSNNNNNNGSLLPNYDPKYTQDNYTVKKNDNSLNSYLQSNGYSNLKYEEEVTYTRRVDKNQSNLYLEYVIYENIVVKPYLVDKNTGAKRQVFNDFNFSNKYIETIDRFSNVNRNGKIYGLDELLQKYRDNINNYIRSNINSNLRYDNDDYQYNSDYTNAKYVFNANRDKYELENAVKRLEMYNPYKYRNARYTEQTEYVKTVDKRVENSFWSKNTVITINERINVYPTIIDSNGNVIARLNTVTYSNVTEINNGKNNRVYGPYELIRAYQYKINDDILNQINKLY